MDFIPRDFYLSDTWLNGPYIQGDAKVIDSIPLDIVNLAELYLTGYWYNVHFGHYRYNGKDIWYVPPCGKLVITHIYKQSNAIDRCFDTISVETILPDRDGYIPDLTEYEELRYPIIVDSTIYFDKKYSFKGIVFGHKFIDLSKYFAINPQGNTGYKYDRNK